MDEFTTHIRGAWFYSVPRLLADGSLTIGTNLQLRREPNNVHDANAVALFLWNSKLGHIPRNLAVRIAPYLDAGGSAETQVIAIGTRKRQGKTSPTVTIRLRLSSFPAQGDSSELLQQSKQYNSKSGVYSITSRDTGQVYIGSSIDVGGRLRRHFTELHAGLHTNAGLSAAYLRHGLGGFAITIIEHVTSGDLGARERFHIEQQDAYARGYNQTIDGQGRTPLPNSSEASQLRDEAKRDYLASQEALRRPPTVYSPPSTAPATKGSGCALTMLFLLLFSLSLLFLN